MKSCPAAGPPISKQLCWHAGFCVCKELPLRKFVINAMSCCRKRFLKGSVALGQLLAGAIVLRFRNTRDDFVFVHMSHQERVGWHCALLPLTLADPTSLEAQIASAHGFTALELPLEELPALPFGTWWQIFKGQNLEVPWSVEVCMLYASQRSCAAQFDPRKILLQPLFPQVCDSLWQGRRLEMQKTTRQTSSRSVVAAPRPKPAGTPAPEGGTCDESGGSTSIPLEDEGDAETLEEVLSGEAQLFRRHGSNCGGKLPHCVATRS